MPTVPIPAGSIRHAGGCLQPVLLRGRVDHIDGSTGELIHRYTTVHEPGGLLPVACKTRRASRCTPCAEVYRADTYQLIRAGLTGGKGVPAEVAHHPCVFVTFTARSFGPVHARRVGGARVLACRPRRNSRTCPHGVRLSCNEKHARDDDRLGEPLCPDCYDYTGAVLFNAYAPELWRRFTITLRRTLARRAGLTGKAFAAQARLSYAKVAEYQRRGVVHFHAIVRVDGPAGPSAAPPAWATLGLLTDAIGQAARTVQVRTPAAPRIPSRTLTWGGQLDIRPVMSAGELTDTTVAGYVAKYATKAAECTGTLDRRVTPADRLDELPVRDHTRAARRTAQPPLDRRRPRRQEDHHHRLDRRHRGRTGQQHHQERPDPRPLYRRRDRLRAQTAQGRPGRRPAPRGPLLARHQGRLHVHDRPGRAHLSRHPYVAATSDFALSAAEREHR